MIEEAPIPELAHMLTGPSRDLLLPRRRARDFEALRNGAAIRGLQGFSLALRPRQTLRFLPRLLGTEDDNAKPIGQCARDCARIMLDAVQRRRLARADDDGRMSLTMAHKATVGLLRPKISWGGRDRVRAGLAPIGTQAGGDAAVRHGVSSIEQVTDGIAKSHDNGAMMGLTKYD
jgi:hypothetical protein